MKEDLYKEVLQTISALTEDETDVISIMSTVCCEVFHAFQHFNWVGIYRLVDEQTLKVGPYQGSHGCLTIDIGRGVCGKCVREKSIQIVNDVSKIPHHIACSAETQSEIVLPIYDKNKRLVAVLDIDSVEAHSFDETDRKYLETITRCIEKGYQA